MKRATNEKAASAIIQEAAARKTGCWLIAPELAGWLTAPATHAPRLRPWFFLTSPSPLCIVQDAFFRPASAICFFHPLLPRSVAIAQREMERAVSDCCCGCFVRFFSDGMFFPGDAKGRQKISPRSQRFLFPGVWRGGCFQGNGLLAARLGGRFSWNFGGKVWPPAALACWPNARYHHTTLDFKHYQEGTLFFLLHVSYRVSIISYILKAADQNFQNQPS